MKKIILSFIFLMVITTACGPSSLDDFREEGSEKTYALIKELKSIQTHEQLVTATPRITRLFNELTDIMIAAREFKEQHPDADLSEPNQRTLTLNRKLQEEMERLYQIDGCREGIEHCQEEAMLRLDTFEKKREANR